MPRSQTERLWMAGGAILALFMIVIGYFLFIGPQRSDTDGVDAQVSSSEQSNNLLQAKLVTLRKQNTELSRYKKLASQSKLALPDTSGMADFLRTLQSIGGSTNTTVTSLTVGDPKDVSAIAAGTLPQPGATAAAAPAAGSSAGKPSVYALPITAQVNGSVTALNDFLTQLQSVQPRGVLVSQIAESVGGSSAGGRASNSSSGTSISLTMFAFVAPSTASESSQLQAKSGK